MIRGIVLMYHRINRLIPDPWNLAVSPAHFAEQVAVLKTLTTVLPLRRLFESSSGVASAITFDDGYHDNLSEGLPVLQRLDSPATIFVTSGRIGDSANSREMWWDSLDRILLQPPTHPAWDWDDADPTIQHTAYRELFVALRRLPPGTAQSIVSALEERLRLEGARPERRMMTPSEVQQIAATGLVEIGAHTVHHPVLAQLPLHAQKFEIEESKRALEELIGGVVSSFAYPNGMPSDYTHETVEIVRNAGFQRACSAFAGVTTPGIDRFQIPRLMVRDWDGDIFGRELRAALDGPASSSGSDSR